MNHKGTVTLETDRLILRKVTKDDLKSVYKYLFHDKKAANRGNWNYYDSYDVFANNFVISDEIDEYQWVLFLKDGRIPIGHLGVHTISDEDQSCEIGYALAYKYWNKGYMTEALKEVIKFLILEVGFNRVAAAYRNKNIASGRVMEKAGMKYEGTLREARYRNGIFLDRHMYSVIKKDIDNN